MHFTFNVIDPEVFDKLGYCPFIFSADNFTNVREFILKYPAPVIVYRFPAYTGCTWKKYSHSNGKIFVLSKG